MASNNDRDNRASLGDHDKFQVQSNRKMNDLDSSGLGQQVTLAGTIDQGSLKDDSMEVVDLSARYRIVSTLAKGCVGEVLLATDTHLNRKVAIKRILGNAARSRNAVNRFLAEAKSIASLNHPNIVKIYDFGRSADGPFLIMEYVDGCSLLDRCRDGALPLAEAVDLACQLCDGLGRAHDAGIIHRDIKPANVLLTKDGIPKLADFGLAKAETADTETSMAGAVLGTLDFMPPEQRRDAALTDARSDLWSLAATVYQMVTGKDPKIIRFNDVPKALQKILVKALENRQEDRYQTARELKQVLKQSLLAGTEEELEMGKCSHCGTKNETNRKFCNKCAKSLEVACLSCSSTIPMWEEICGQCETNQSEIATERLKEITKKRECAEKLRDKQKYQAALELAQEISEIDHSRLNQFRSWSQQFLASTRAEWDHQVEIAKQSFTEARKHRAAFDYVAALYAMESIPEAIRSLQQKQYLQTLLALHQESSELIDTIATHIRKRTIDEILPLAERAFALRGDREDLKKLVNQLRDRKAKQNLKLDEAFAVAESLLAEGKAKEAFQTINTINAKILLNSHKEFCTNLEELNSAEMELVSMVKEAKADGVIEPHKIITMYSKVVDYLQRNPKHVAIGMLQRDLIVLLEKIPLIYLHSLPEDVLLRLPGSIYSKIRMANSIGMQLRLLLAGKFIRGENDNAHEVTLSKPFYLGIYPVTQEQYQQVMGNNPSHFVGGQHPVEGVSWEYALEFCQKLSSLPEEKLAGRVYRLPTEAEWEYACRAGSKASFCFGDDNSKLGEYAWFENNSDGETHPVGLKKSNSWGLYDMHGNVFEWCWDWYGAYPKGAVADPTGPVRPYKDYDRVYRGGGYCTAALFCRSSVREGFFLSQEETPLGFRVALSSPGIPK